MSKSHYDVVIVIPGQKEAYFAYWVDGVTKNADGSSIRTDQLSFTESIEARNEAEALSIAQSKYPDHFVDADSIRRLG